jgi:hypothetical protein
MDMKYFREFDGAVWAFLIDGSQDSAITETMVAMTEEEVYLHLNPPPTFEQLSFIENQWRESQMARIANQLLMIEDEDPDVEPGTKRQWMDYRIALRKWVEGSSVDFPDATKRPQAPE